MLLAAKLLILLAMYAASHSMGSAWEEAQLELVSCYQTCPGGLDGWGLVF